MYNGKQLKNKVSKFKDDDLVTAIFVTERMVRNENTDGWWTNEFQSGFEGEKLNKKQVEQILGKISKLKLDNELIKECVESNRIKEDELYDNLLND